MPEASLTLAGDASSVPAARHFVARTLAAWGYDDAGWAAAQIVSELAGNCALHARTEFHIRLRQQNGQVRLEVQDGSLGRVAPRRYSSESTTGRGLQLVELLAQTWGVDIGATGKTVWAELPLSAEASGGSEQLAEPDLDVADLLAAFDDDAGTGPTSRARPLATAA